MSNQRKKTSRSVLLSIGVFLLTTLLIIGGSICFLYFAVTTNPLTIDDPAALAEQTPMPASRRFVFDADKETAQIRLDKSDLWWLLLPEMEENFLDDVNRELENYQIRVTGYGFNITKKGIIIDLEAMYQSVRLPVHIHTLMDFDASGFTMTLTKAKLGPFRIPAGDFLSAMDVRLDVDWPVITDITDVAYHLDTVVLTGTLTKDMLSCVQEACKNDAIGWFSTSHQAVFRAGREENGFRELLPKLEKDPGSVEKLYHDLFTMAQVYEYEDFMKASKNLSHRFFPGIDFSALEAENDAVRAQWVLCDVMMDKLVTQVSKDFNSRQFSLKNGAFYLKKNVFDPLNYFTGDTALKMQQLFHVIDQDQFRLILVGSINGYAVKSPALNRICAKDQELTQELNRKDAYPIGCVFRGRNGEYVLRYESMKISGTGSETTKVLKTVILSEAEYDSLAQEGKIGVWIS